MAAERLVVGGWPVVRGDGSANGVSNRGVRGIDLGGRALQRFADDLLRCEVHPEQGLGHSRHFKALIFAAAAARHGGGRADADDVVAEGVAAAADEHRDVGALAAAIGVQLVEHEKPEPLGGSHQLAVLASGEQQLQHHVVREQDVRRIASDRLALVLMQEELLAAVVGVGLVDPEDLRAFPVEYPQLDQFIDRAAGPERRVELEERLRPEAPCPEDAVDERLDPRIANLDEAARVAPVAGDQAVPEVKDVHVEPSRPPPRLPTVRDGYADKAVRQR